VVNQSIYMYVGMNRGLDTCLYKGMYRGRVAPAAVTNNLRVLHAARSEANGPRGEGARGLTLYPKPPDG